MKKVWSWFAKGCVLAIVGMYFSAICGNFITVVHYDTACVLVMGMYLCVVVVTCTGIIVSKITSKQNEDTLEEKGD